MTMKKFKHVPVTFLGPKLSESDLEKLEHALSAKLPDDYRSFLLEYNGGCLDERYDYIVTFDYPGGYNPYSGGDNQSDLMHFFRLTYNWFDGHDIFELWNSVYRERMPSHFLPIAEDSCGNVFCLSLGKNDYGWIYFWDHERESPIPDYSNCYKIAESFIGFIDSLILEPDS